MHFRQEAVDAFRGAVTSRQHAGWSTPQGADLLGKRAPTAPYPLHHLIHQSLLACQPALRRDLAHHVVLTGGASTLRGLERRLYWEVLTLVPAAFKPRIVAAPPREREFAAWIGASVLASLGTFQQMWVSKAEYNEVGPSCVEAR